MNSFASPPIPPENLDLIRSLWLFHKELPSLVAAWHKASAATSWPKVARHNGPFSPSSLSMFSIFIPELASPPVKITMMHTSWVPAPNSKSQSGWGPQTQHCFLNIQKHVQNEFEDFPAEILNHAGTVGHDGSRNSQNYANSGKLWLNFWFKIIWSIVSPNIPHFATSKMGTSTIPPRCYTQVPQAICSAKMSSSARPRLAISGTRTFSQRGSNVGWDVVRMIGKKWCGKDKRYRIHHVCCSFQKNWGLWLLMDPKFIHNITDSWLM